jgi:hypothetical protein
MPRNSRHSSNKNNNICTTCILKMYTVPVPIKLYVSQTYRTLEIDKVQNVFSNSNTSSLEAKFLVPDWEGDKVDYGIG